MTEPSTRADPGPALGDLLAYAVDRGVIESADIPWAVNRILEVLRLDAPGSFDAAALPAARADADQAVAGLLDVAATSGRIADTPGQRDLLDAAVFGALMPAPSLVADRFWLRHHDDPVAATDGFYRLSVDVNYVHAARSQANPRWEQPTAYGSMDITINLAKPEKDPRDIAAALAQASEVAASAYPTCLLCVQNEGYAGRVDHPARQNLRLIPMELAGRPWAMQYSPYLYYPEHCIVLDTVHQPMRLTRDTFVRLMQFVAHFPHYFLGSNADLPIVGGSILTHDHFQGGRYRFPIEGAETLADYRSATGVTAQVLSWPLATVRLTADDPQALVDTGEQMLTAWREYDDVDAGVYAVTDGTPHNTVTPIARRAGEAFQLDMVLRNNRADDRHPDGIFHPHAEIHPVKRENIGLIEVMGLAVLPGRLAADIPRLARALAGEELPDDLAAHRTMLDGIAIEAETVKDLGAYETAVRRAVGEYFVTGLEHCGVFGAAEQSLPGWDRFLTSLGYRQD